jgi:hypothetical protein
MAKTEKKQRIEKTSYRWLPEDKWKLIGVPVFFGIITFLFSFPLMKLDLAFRGSTDVCMIAFSQATSAIMWGLSTALPIVIAMVMGAKYMRSNKIVSSLEIAIIALVFSIVYTLPFVIGYAMEGYGWDLGRNVAEIMLVYMTALIGCFIGAKTAR